MTDSNREGVIFFNRGTKCYIRLCVAIATLRKHYAGPVLLLHEGHVDQWLKEWLDTHDVSLQYIGEPECHVLVRKATLWRHSPFQYTVFLDADTLVQADIQPFFNLVEQHGVVVTQFAQWTSSGLKMRKRIRDWTDVDPSLIDPAIDFGPAVNTGVMGWTKGAPILEAWEKLSAKGFDAGCNRIVLDEVAMQLLLPQFNPFVAESVWNTSAAYQDPESAKILHYHGRKHVHDFGACAIWKSAYWDLRSASPWSNQLSQTFGDRRLRDYLNSGHRNDLTIVTAVTPRYWDKLKHNMLQWMKTSGLREQNFLVFVNGFKNKRQRSWLDQFDNVRVVRWDFPAAGDNYREMVLSAFVFGVARYVKTDYWMKIDADQSLGGPNFEIPNYRESTITGHRWGFTRVKGDPTATKHWLNTLDDWWDGDPLFPPNIPIDIRYDHPRTMSQLSIENTDFTRRLAKLCGKRLPIPSQDTTAWYVATRLGEPISRTNLKKCFK